MRWSHILLRGFSVVFWVFFLNVSKNSFVRLKNLHGSVFAGLTLLFPLECKLTVWKFLPTFTNVCSQLQLHFWFLPFPAASGTCQAHRPFLQQKSEQPGGFIPKEQPEPSWDTQPRPRPRGALPEPISNPHLEQSSQSLNVSSVTSFRYLKYLHCHSWPINITLFWPQIQSQPCSKYVFLSRYRLWTLLMSSLCTSVKTEGYSSVWVTDAGRGFVHCCEPVWQVLSPSVLNREMGWGSHPQNLLLNP